MIPLKGEKAISPGQRPGCCCSRDLGPERAKAIIQLLASMLLPFQGANPNVHRPRALPWAGCLLAFASRWSATFGSGRYFSNSLPDTNNLVLNIYLSRMVKTPKVSPLSNRGVRARRVPPVRSAQASHPGGVPEQQDM